MEKQRNIKILSIVALVLAIAGLTLGFAAFSATLNISSSASVSPNSDAFKVRFAGLNGDNKVIITNYSGIGGTAEPAIISSDGLSIVGINVPLSEIGDAAVFSAYIENTGEYDAHITKLGLKNVDGFDKTIRCIGETVNPDLLINFCQNMGYTFAFFTEDGKRINYTNISDVVIKKGERIVFSNAVYYSEDSGYVDGLVNVEIGDAYIEFGVYAE